jgi:hypothetical protein
MLCAILLSVIGKRYVSRKFRRLLQTCNLLLLLGLSVLVIQ